MAVECWTQMLRQSSDDGDVRLRAAFALDLSMQIGLDHACSNVGFQDSLLRCCGDAETAPHHLKLVCGHAEIGQGQKYCGKKSRRKKAEQVSQPLSLAEAGTWFQCLATSYFGLLGFGLQKGNTVKRLCVPITTAEEKTGGGHEGWRCMKLWPFPVPVLGNSLGEH